MSSATEREAEQADAGDEPYPPACEFCGLFIEAEDQECVALDDGRCQP